MENNVKKSKISLMSQNGINQLDETSKKNDIAYFLYKNLIFKARRI